MTETLEELSTNAATKLYDLMEGSYLCNDGADAYVSIDLPELNDIDTGYVIASVPTLERGKDAKWTVENGAHTLYFEHPEFTAATPAKEVEAWVSECIKKVVEG